MIHGKWKWNPAQIEIWNLNSSSQDEDYLKLPFPAELGAPVCGHGAKFFLSHDRAIPHVTLRKGGEGRRRENIIVLGKQCPWQHISTSGFWHVLFWPHITVSFIRKPHFCSDFSHLFSLAVIFISLDWTRNPSFPSKKVGLPLQVLELYLSSWYLSFISITRQKKKSHNFNLSVYITS